MKSLKKWAPWVVVVVAAAVALGFGLQSRNAKPSLDAQVQHISSLVACPVCNGESAAASQAAPAVAIRNQIRTELQAGESQTQILNGLVNSYGASILEKPPASGVGAVVWVVPVVGGVAGVAIVVLLLRRWRRRGGAEDDAVEDGAAGLDDDSAESLEPVTVTAAAEGLADGPATADGPAGAEITPRPPKPGHRRGTRIGVLVAGLALVAGGASWAVVASSGTRLAGEEITGASLTSEQIDAELVQANTDENAGNTLQAIQDYQKVLNSDASQIEALSGQGWLLVGTGEPSLLEQGLGKLAQAEKVQPTYAPAHLYRGLALLGEADYAPAATELEWYLAHQPDQSLVPEVKKALTTAQTGAAASAKDTGKTAPTAPASPSQP